LGYEEAKPGENFVKIGVGAIRKPEEPAFRQFETYDIADHGKWTIHKRADSVEFIQKLSDTRGYAYIYKKTVRLVRGKPEMVLEHSLRNTGKKAIATSVYEHNFYMLDQQPAGPDYTVRFPFEVHPRADLAGAAEARGKDFTYLRELQAGQSVFTQMDGFGGMPRDYDIRVENRKAGIGVRQTSDRPMSIKLCAQSDATPSDDQLLFLKQIGAEYVSVGGSGLRTAEGFPADQEALCRRRHHGMEHRQQQRAQHAGSDAEPAGARPEDRGIQAVPAQPGEGGIYYTTYAHMGNGIWSSGRATIRGSAGARVRYGQPRISSGVWDGNGGVQRAAVARARVHQRGDLGELHLLHQAGGAGGGGGRVRIGIHPTIRRCRCWRACRAASSASFDGYRARHGDRQQPERGDLPVLRDVAGRRPAAYRQRSGRDDPLFRRAEDLEDPFPQRERAAAALRGNVHGQRLLRHVQDHESAARRELRRHRDPGSFAGDGGRQ
jgi:hypothetical protein